MKNLIFFTSQFPYGEGETFVENEFPFLTGAFEKIFIVTNDVAGRQMRQFPANVVVIRVPYSASLKNKLRSLISFFNPVIQQELNFIKNHLLLSANIQILSALLGSYAHALETEQLILKIVRDYKLELSSLYLYSYWMNNMAAGIALFKQKHPETRAICRAHGWDVYFERHSPPYLPLRKFIIENINACYCISENGKEYLEKLIGANAKHQIKLSRLGTFNKFNKKSATSPTGLSIVSCSNIIPLKRIHLIIESLALLKDIQVTWTHFGSGGLEAQTKEYADKILSHMSNIKYHFAGQKGNVEVLNYYAYNPVDLFINVSETEGLPVSIMEAFSFSIPAIAMNVGGISEIINDGLNGILLRPDSTIAEIASAINTFYNLSEDKKISLRKHAFLYWEEKFNAEKNYKNFIADISAL